MKVFAILAVLFCVSWPISGATKTGSTTITEDKSAISSAIGIRELTRTRKRTLKITNLSYLQPFSPFFVMVHNDDAAKLYVPGEMASMPLAILAEDGDPGPLVDFYMGAEGVKSVMSFMDGAPFKGGDTLEIVVEVSKDFPLVTIASMAINTNDCFVAMNGVQIFKGMVGVFDGLDSGSEENNELCSSIPGPGCAMESGNVQSGNGEGFVHVHRGMQDVNPEELPSFEYDWRNPMMRVEVM